VSDRNQHLERCRLATRTLLALNKGMHAIPLRLIAQLEVTGLACPDCSGVLAARVEGRDHSLAFECRVGHTDDVSELLQAKEEVLEERLWSAATGLREL
jgi:hypothetical protein